MTAGCCIMGVAATTKTTISPYLWKNSSVSFHVVESRRAGKNSNSQGRPSSSTIAASPNAPTVEPIATVNAKINHRFGVSMALEMRMPSLGITRIRLSRAASKPISGGYQKRSANACKDFTAF